MYRTLSIIISNVIHLVQKFNIPNSQFEGLNLGQLVGRKRGHDLPQRREASVEAHGPLPLPHVGEGPGMLDLLERLLITFRLVTEAQF